MNNAPRPSLATVTVVFSARKPVKDVPTPFSLMIVSKLKVLFILEAQIIRVFFFWYLDYFCIWYLDYLGIWYFAI